MKPFSNVTIVTLLFIFTSFSCSTDSLDDDLYNQEINSVDNPVGDESGTVNDQLDYKIIPSDFDWANIPASYADNIWEIRFAFNLSAASITLPDNVTLKFIGGTIGNYTSISGENTKIDAGLVGSFDGSGVLTGNLNLEEVYPEWFGALGDGTTYDADSFISAVGSLNLSGGGDLILTNGKDYVIDKEILLSSNIHVLGNSAEISVATTTYNTSPNRFFAIFTTVHIDKRPESAPYASFGDGIIKFDNIHIKDITFNINRDGNSLALGVMRSSDFNAVRFVDTENSIVENCNFIDKQTPDTWILVSVVTFEKSNNCKAINNNFDRCTAIAISEGTANVIDGNIMNNSPGTQVEVFVGTHHQIINNTTNAQWYAVSTIGTSAKYSIVSNNTINASSYTGITMGHRNEVAGADYGADYSVVENNTITGGAVSANTGRIGIFSQNAIGLRIRNNVISNLFKGDSYDNQDAAILVSGATTEAEQSWHDDLIVDGNTIVNVTTAIQIRDMINANISNNTISDVLLGIYGESNAANSPNSKLTLSKNTISDTSIALFLNGPENIVTNNTITGTDDVGYLYYGQYTFSHNIIIEGLKGPHSFHPLSFTMKNNYFYNTLPLGTLTEGSIMTMRAPDMGSHQLIVEGNEIDHPASERPTTWVLRAYELQGHSGSQYFN